MQIAMKTKGEIVGFHLTVNKKRDGSKRYVEVEFGRTREELEATIGADLTAMIFAGYAVIVDSQDDGDATEGVWHIKNPKFTGKVVPEQHKITINRTSYQGEPRITEFKTVEKTEKVIMVVQLELGEAQTDLRHYCESNPNKPIPFAFEPSKIPFPTKGKKSDKTNVTSLPGMGGA